MLEGLKFMLSIIIFLILSLIALVFLIVILVAGVNYTGYFLNKANCIAKVDNNTVYNGNCHFIALDSVGENGNTKVLKVYKDKTGFILLKQYASDNITITESEE